MPVNSFQEEWENDFPWVKEGKLNGEAQCTWCNSTVSFDTMGRAALSSHWKGKKHQEKTLDKGKSGPISQFLRTPLIVNQTSATTPVANILLGVPNLSSLKQQTCSTLEKYTLKDSITEAEIIYSSVLILL